MLFTARVNSLCTMDAIVAIATAMFSAAEVTSGNCNPLMVRDQHTHTKWLTNHNTLGQMTSLKETLGTLKPVNVFLNLKQKY